MNQDVANDADNPQIALDAKGNPVVAWSELGKVLVKRWTGSAWALVGTGSANTGTLSVFDKISLALDSGGNPVLAWVDYSPPDPVFSRVYVNRWNGSTWETLGNGTININQDKLANHPTLALDSSGNPFVAWAEYSNDPNRVSVFNVYVKRWTGKSWVLVSPPGGPTTVNQDETKSAGIPVLALDSNGNPVVAWSESTGIGTFPTDNLFVKRWNGTTWLPVGTGTSITNASDYVRNISLALDQRDNPVVAYQTLNRVFVTRWTGSAWALIGPGFINQDANLLGTSPSLVLDPSGNPVVAWDEYGKRTPQVSYLKRWTGSSWALLGADTINQDSRLNSLYPSIVLDSSGRPVVALTQYTGQKSYVIVKRYNR